MKKRALAAEECRKNLPKESAVDLRQRPCVASRCRCAFQWNGLSVLCREAGVERFKRFGDLTRMREKHTLESQKARRSPDESGSVSACLQRESPKGTEADSAWTSQRHLKMSL